MHPTPLPHAKDLLPAIRAACAEAGQLALDLFRPGEKTAARTWSKAGGSPVTEADIGVDTFLHIRLAALLPEAGWLSEETADDAIRLSRRFVWVVDPIDGTRAFMGGSPDWAVCVALLDDGDIMAVADQLVGDQGGSDATANHRHLAAQILLQGREGMHQTVLDGPERIAAFQIHAQLRSSAGR